MAGRHKAHHGHEQPEPSAHHAKNHDKIMDGIDRHHAEYVSRGRGHHVSEGHAATIVGGGSSSGRTTANVAGSNRMVGEGGRSVKGAGMREHKPNEMKTLRKVAGGRPDTASGKNVA